MIPPTPQEIAYRFVWGMLNIGDMAIPHYWSNLFLSMNSLLDEDKMVILRDKVKQVTKMCGVKKQIVEKEIEIDGQIEIIKQEEEVPVMKLYEIETYLMNSWNLKNYFLVSGQKITQFEIERKLYDVKAWCFQEVFMMQRQILFTKPPMRV